MDRGGYIAFGLNNEEILLLSDNQFSGKSINGDYAVFQGVFDLNASHKNIGKELTFSKKTQFIQIQFMPMVENYEIVEGKAICIFNGNARIEFMIPKQLISNKQIFIRDIKGILDEKYN